MNWTTKDRLLGCWIGLAVGDATGTTLEFKQRDTYEHITDMVGGGPFNLRPGQWTDDTSMAICLAESILATGRIDADDLRARWRDWWLNGTNSSTGRCFDIGIGTAAALRTGKAEGAGNGALMRLAPVVLRWWCYPGDRISRSARSQSDVTHDALAGECASYLANTLIGLVFDHGRRTSNLFRKISCLTRNEISSSGYCVHTLEAAVWCLATDQQLPRRGAASGELR